jgi:hypothetical protein
MGNTTIVSIPISYDGLIIDKAYSVNYFVKVSKDNSFAKNNMSVFFPAGTFYEDFDMNFDVKDETLYLHDETTPVHSVYRHKYMDSQKEKYL